MKQSFRDKVFKIVKQIPRGSVLTYREVAQKAGNKKAYRAVGNILNKNYDPEIPCHRVVRSDGKIGGYNRGSGKKQALLIKENVIIKKWRSFTSFLERKPNEGFNTWPRKRKSC